MKPLAKFLFDTSFDVDDAPAAEAAAQEAANVEPVPPPAPSFSEEELAAAREEARAEGRAEGEAAVRASLEQAAVMTLGRLAGALPGLARQIEEGFVRNARLMLEASVAALGRLAPELSRRGGLIEVEGLLQQTVRDLRDESRIVVRLNDQLLDRLSARLDHVARSTGFEGRIVLLADDEIAVGDCRIEWADGGVERITSRVWAEIEAAVKRALAASDLRGSDASVPASTGAKPQET